MSDINNKPAAEQQAADITIKELLSISNLISFLFMTIEKADFISGAIQNEFSEINEIDNKNEELFSKAFTFEKILQWQYILDDYIVKSSKYAKALSTEYDRIYNKLKGSIQNV